MDNLPDCQYDYYPEAETVEAEAYCERCGEGISDEVYDENDGYCDRCKEYILEEMIEEEE